MKALKLDFEYAKFVQGGNSSSRIKSVSVSEKSLRVLVDSGIEADYLRLISSLNACHEFGETPFKEIEAWMKMITNVESVMITDTPLAFLRARSRGAYCELLSQQFYNSLNEKEQDELARLLRDRHFDNDQRGVATAALHHWHDQIAQASSGQL